MKSCQHVKLIGRNKKTVYILLTKENPGDSLAGVGLIDTCVLSFCPLSSKIYQPPAVLSKVDGLFSSFSMARHPNTENQMPKKFPRFSKC